jgi:hypothetical protein
LREAKFIWGPTDGESTRGETFATLVSKGNKDAVVSIR